jgi:hypothetical protein
VKQVTESYIEFEKDEPVVLPDLLWNWIDVTTYEQAANGIKAYIRGSFRSTITGLATMAEAAG